MIEVEKKFLLNKDQEKSLLEGAEFLGEKVFTDIYYDTVDFVLTSKDNWLRSRAGKWELKLSLNPDAVTRVGDFYNEIETEEEIRKILIISGTNSMENDLEKCGYSKFCACKTTRKKYKKNGFGIDVDYVEFGDFNYNLAEIELMIEYETESAEAIEKIIEFAKENGLEVKYVRGKVIEYLRCKSPAHFQALVDLGVIRPD